jgi:hypothetical protein
MFEKAFLESLEESRPEEYRRLKASGQLRVVAEEAAQRADDQHHTLLSQLRRQDPGPASSLLQAQHLNTLSQQAREIVLDELMVKPNELED